MSIFNISSLSNTTLLPVIFFLLAFLYLLVNRYCKSKEDSLLQEKLDKLSNDLRKEIQFSVSPKFIQLSLGVNELVDLAIEVWRMDQRIKKASSNLPETQLRGLENSIQKMTRYLEKYDIEIIDYKNIKYNDGLNVDILSMEKDPSLSDPMVKETVEPTIMLKGQVIRKAKIILLSNH